MIRSYGFRIRRWLWVTPELGDRRGWITTALIRLPLIVVAIVVLSTGMLLATPLGLGLLRGDRRMVIVYLVAVFGGLFCACGVIAKEAFERKSALAQGAVPYAAIGIKQTGVRVNFKGRRVWIPWSEVVGTSVVEGEFELRWGADGRLFGVHVSPMQSSLLPSGELPDDETMAAWINELKAASSRRVP